jgi:hypothetical protein
VRAPSCDPGGVVNPRSIQGDDGAFRREDGVGLHRYCFRGSITRPTHSLFTLRSQGRPCTTQNSLPAGDHPGRVGIGTPTGLHSKVSAMVLVSESSRPPSPSLPVATSPQATSCVLWAHLSLGLQALYAPRHECRVSRLKPSPCEGSDAKGTNSGEGRLHPRELKLRGWRGRRRAAHPRSASSHRSRLRSPS